MFDWFRNLFAKPKAAPAADIPMPPVNPPAPGPNINMTPDKCATVLEDGILITRNDKGEAVLAYLKGHRLTICILSRYGAELGTAVPEGVVIKDNAEAIDYAGILLLIPDSMLPMPFMQWREEDRAHKAKGFPVGVARDIPLSSGFTLLCARLDEESLDLDGRAAIRCMHYTKTEPEGDIEESPIEVAAAVEEPDGPCPHCGSTPYDLTRCRKCGSPEDIASGAVREVLGFDKVPDRHCVTRADGECVSTDPRCMHQDKP